MSSMIDLARPAIQKLVPYSSARLENNQEGIHLDANENPYCRALNFNRYPEHQPSLLKQQLASLYGVMPTQVLVTRGSDEGIDLLIRVFCEANKDTILVTPPTYGMYEVAANIQGAGIQKVPLQEEDGFALNKDQILKQWQPNTKLIFFCSPNNPTGNTLDKNTLLSITEQLRDKAIVVVDEAYIEFAESESLCAVINQYPNLVILRTLSKAFGLAGVRVGSLIAQEELIELFKKVLAPYPIPLPVQTAALTALAGQNQVLVREQRVYICNQRERLKHFLQALPSVERVYPSSANFLLVRVKKAAIWMKACEQNQIIIRSRETLLGLENCVRITIGTENEMQALKEVLSYV